MNNKRLGTKFERFMCKYLANEGYWVHFVSPDARGSQPFDIIAVRDDLAVAIDCKTCADRIFRIGRLEDNQIYAFDRWGLRGNKMAYIAVLHGGKVYMLHYGELKKEGRIILEEKNPYIDGVVL